MRSRGVVARRGSRDNPNRGRTAQRAGAGPHRGDAVHGAGRDRRDHPRDRRAGDRDRPRRVQPVPVAVLDLPAGPGRVSARSTASSPTAAGASRSCWSASRCSSPDRCSAVPRGPCLLLIASRAVQGLGAGAILPMSMTIVGDIYTVEERARVQGYIASVWGMASIVGPTLGGVFSRVPVLALDLLRQPARGRARRLDAGAALPRARRAQAPHASTTPARACSPPGARC